MQINSLGYRTDLIFPRYEGDILDRGHYLVIRTPKNPYYYWGNFLLFDRPPVPGDLQRWKAIFAEEIGEPPKANHIALGWDSPDGEMGAIEPFLADGFEREEVEILSAPGLTPSSRHRSDLDIRPLTTDGDWDAALENQVACFRRDEEEAPYRVYKKGKMVRYRDMAERGLGVWYGAFQAGKLVGDLGIYIEPETSLGRYQSVGTHPEFRGQGVCATLVVEAGRNAQARFNLERLVIAADPGYHAIGIYEGVGFQCQERQIGLCRA